MVFLCSERKDKPMHRIFLLIMILLVFFTLAVPAFAEEVGEAPALEVTTAAEPVESEPSEESLAEEISGILKEWVPEILSAAALAISALIAYLFKKGLLPKVLSALKVIDGTVSGYNEKAEALVQTISEKLKMSEVTTAALMERFTLQESEVNKALYAASKILLAQSESLFDLLENTNLPANVKAKISAKHREQLSEINALIGGDHSEE